MQIPSPKGYFEGNISRGFVCLYTTRSITMIAGGLLGIFLPIFLYNLFGQKFHYVAWFYALGYFLYLLALFFFIRFLNKYGFRRALRTSIFLGAAYYAVFYFIDENNYRGLLLLVLLTITLYRLFYWIPYHVDFAKFTDKRNRGRQISAMRATRNTIGIFVPLIAGFVISRYGFDVLFLTAIMLFLVSGIPLLTIPHAREKYRWGYKKTLKNLVAKENRKEAVAFASDGAEAAFVAIVWPIFIFQLLKGDFLKVGAISTLVIGFTVIIQLLLGKKMDVQTPKEKVLKIGTALSAMTWFAKIFIETAFQVFVVSAFHNLIRIFTRTPFDTLTYEIAADRGHYVDEFTVFRELSINASRVLVLIGVGVLSLYLPIQYLFVIAAIAAVCLNLLRKNIQTPIGPGLEEKAVRM
jgi:MFS family permease